MGLLKQYSEDVPSFPSGCLWKLGAWKNLVCYQSFLPPQGSCRFIAWSTDPWPHEGNEAEIDRVRSLGVDSLRTLWRTTFRSSPPPAFSKDILARYLCWHIQEQACGGLDPKTAKHLDGLARGDRSRASRRLKPGTVLLREYQGERHTVTVVAKGYVWREATYASLSSIARAITGRPGTR